MSDPGRRIAELYDRWARTYDEDANRTRDLAAAALAQELPPLEGCDVVELGCGTGTNTARLAEESRSVVALDFSRGMLERARTQLAGRTPARFVRHDIRTPLPLRAGTADVVVITLVLEHVEALPPVFLEASRILREGGALFVAELHPVRQEAGVRARFAPRAGGKTVEVPAHVHSVRDFVDSGRAAAFELERMREWRDEKDEGEGRPPRLLSLLFRRAG